MDKEMDIYEDLRQVEVSVANNIKLSNRELIQTRYYKEFLLKSEQGEMTFRNFFITVEKNKKGKISYHFRWLEKKLSTIEENLFIEDDGKVHSSVELRDIIDDINVNIKELINENDMHKNRLIGISEKLTQEQIKELLSEDENKKEQEHYEYIQKIEADFAKQGEMVKIGKHKRINTDNISGLVPGIFEETKKYAIIEDKIQGNFIVVEKDNEHYKKNVDIQFEHFTVKRIFLTTSKGEVTKIEIPEQIMNIDGYSTKKISIQVDKEGKINLHLVKTVSCKNIK